MNLTANSLSSAFSLMPNNTSALAAAVQNPVGYRVPKYDLINHLVYRQAIIDLALGVSRIGKTSEMGGSLGLEASFRQQIYGPLYAQISIGGRAGVNQHRFSVTEKGESEPHIDSAYLFDGEAHARLYVLWRLGRFYVGPYGEFSLGGALGQYHNFGQKDKPAADYGWHSSAYHSGGTGLSLQSQFGPLNLGIRAGVSIQPNSVDSDPFLLSSGQTLFSKIDGYDLFFGGVFTIGIGFLPKHHRHVLRPVYEEPPLGPPPENPPPKEPKDPVLPPVKDPPQPKDPGTSPVVQEECANNHAPKIAADLQEKIEVVPNDVDSKIVEFGFPVVRDQDSASSKKGQVHYFWKFEGSDGSRSDWFELDKVSFEAKAGVQYIISYQAKDACNVASEIVQQKLRVVKNEIRQKEIASLHIGQNLMRPVILASNNDFIPTESQIGCANKLDALSGEAATALYPGSSADSETNKPFVLSNSARIELYSRVLLPAFTSRLDAYYAARRAVLEDILSPNEQDENKGYEKFEKTMIDASSHLYGFVYGISDENGQNLLQQTDEEIKQAEQHLAAADQELMKIIEINQGTLVIKEKCSANKLNQCHPPFNKNQRPQIHALKDAANSLLSLDFDLGQQTGLYKQASKVAELKHQLAALRQRRENLENYAFSSIVHSLLAVGASLQDANRIAEMLIYLRSFHLQQGTDLKNSLISSGEDAIFREYPSMELAQLLRKVYKHARDTQFDILDKHQNRDKQRIEKINTLAKDSKNFDSIREVFFELAADNSEVLAAVLNTDFDGCGKLLSDLNPYDNLKANSAVVSRNLSAFAKMLSDDAQIYKKDKETTEEAKGYALLGLGILVTAASGGFFGLAAMSFAGTTFAVGTEGYNYFKASKKAKDAVERFYIGVTNEERAKEAISEADLAALAGLVNISLALLPGIALSKAGPIVTNLLRAGARGGASRNALAIGLKAVPKNPLVAAGIVGSLIATGSSAAQILILNNNKEPQNLGYLIKTIVISAGVGAAAGVIGYKAGLRGAAIQDQKNRPFAYLASENPDQKFGVGSYLIRPSESYNWLQATQDLNNCEVWRVESVDPTSGHMTLKMVRSGVSRVSSKSETIVVEIDKLYALSPKQSGLAVASARHKSLEHQTVGPAIKSKQEALDILADLSHGKAKETFKKLGVFASLSEDDAILEREFGVVKEKVTDGSGDRDGFVYRIIIGAEDEIKLSSDSAVLIGHIHHNTHGFVISKLARGITRVGGRPAPADIVTLSKAVTDPMNPQNSFFLPSVPDLINSYKVAKHFNNDLANFKTSHRVFASLGIAPDGDFVPLSKFKSGVVYEKIYTDFDSVVYEGTENVSGEHVFSAHVTVRAGSGRILYDGPAYGTTTNQLEMGPIRFGKPTKGTVTPAPSVYVSPSVEGVTAYGQHLILATKIDLLKKNIVALNARIISYEKDASSHGNPLRKAQARQQADESRKQLSAKQKQLLLLEKKYEILDPAQSKKFRELKGQIVVAQGKCYGTLKIRNMDNWTTLGATIYIVQDNHGVKVVLEGTIKHVIDTNKPEQKSFVIELKGASKKKIFVKMLPVEESDVRIRSLSRSNNLAEEERNLISEINRAPTEELKATKQYELDTYREIAAYLHMMAEDHPEIPPNLLEVYSLNSLYWAHVRGKNGEMFYRHGEKDLTTAFSVAEMKKGKNTKGIVDQIEANLKSGSVFNPTHLNQPVVLVSPTFNSEPVFIARLSKIKQVDSNGVSYGVRVVPSAYAFARGVYYDAYAKTLRLQANSIKDPIVKSFLLEQSKKYHRIPVPEMDPDFIKSNWKMPYSDNKINLRIDNKEFIKSYWDAYPEQEHRNAVLPSDLDLPANLDYAKSLFNFYTREVVLRLKAMGEVYYNAFIVRFNSLNKNPVMQAGLLGRLHSSICRAEVEGLLGIKFEHIINNSSP